jgi:hypothetical protein
MKFTLFALASIAFSADALLSNPVGNQKAVSTEK